MLYKLLKSFVLFNRGRVLSLLIAGLIVLLQYDVKDLIRVDILVNQWVEVAFIITTILSLGYVIDISYRARLLNQKKQEVYRSFFEFNPDASYCLSLTGQFTELNHSTALISGYSRDELLKINFLPILHKEERSKALHLFKKVLDGESVLFDTRIIRKDGDIRHINVTAVPIYVNGTILGCIGIARDLTEEVQLRSQRQIDLKLAKEIQKGLLPSNFLSDTIKIKGYYQPSEELSGDMYYWTRINEHKYAVMILDVVGHGIASSLICTSIRSLLNGLIEKEQDPIKVIVELIRQITPLYIDNNQIDSTVYFTAFYLLIDTEARKIEYVSAGHPAALLINQNTIHQLDEGTVPIGILPLEQMQPITKGEVTYDPQSKLLLYTDGLSDIYGGQNKWIQTVHHLISVNHSVSLDQMILEDLNQKGQNKLDDITLVTIELS